MHAPEALYSVSHRPGAKFMEGCELLQYLVNGSGASGTFHWGGGGVFHFGKSSI